MWIFDSYYKGTVELWGRENGPIKVSLPFPNSFYMHLRDPPAYREMLAALEGLYRVEEWRRSRSRPATLPSFTMWT